MVAKAGGVLSWGLPTINPPPPPPPPHLARAPPPPPPIYLHKHAHTNLILSAGGTLCLAQTPGSVK